MKIVSKFKIDGKETSGLYYDKVEKINIQGEDHRFAKEVNTTKIVKEAVSEPFTRMELVGNSQQDHKTKNNVKSNGYCLKYNQLLNFTFTTYRKDNFTVTNLNNYITIIGSHTIGGDPNLYVNFKSIKTISGHKYIYLNSSNNFASYIYGSMSPGIIGTNGTIFTPGTGTLNLTIRPNPVPTTTINYNESFYIQIADLTDMFGAGNEPTTLAAFYLTYQGMFFRRGYVEYGYGLLGSGVYKINQLAQPTWAGEQYGVTRAYPVENFIRSVTLNGTASITMDWSMFTFDAIKDHYYLIHSYPGRANYLKIWYSGAISSGDTYDEYYIIKANSTGLASVYFSLYQNQNYNIKFTPSVVDLTDISADNLTTVTQLRSSRPEVFAPMRNYPLGTTKYGYIFNDGTIFDLEYDYIDLSKITTWQMTAPGKFMAVINDINMYECGVDDLPDIYVENGKYTPYVYNNYGDAYDKGITTYKYGESTIYLRINDSDYQTLDSFVNSLPGIKMKYYTKFKRPLLGTETFTSTGKIVRKVKRIDVNTQLGYWGEWPDGTVQAGYKGYFTYGAFVNIPASKNGYCNLFERNVSAYGGYPEGFNFHGDYISFNVKTSDFPTLNDFLSYADSHGLFVLYEDEDNVMEFDDMEPEITATFISNEIGAVNYPYTTPTPKFPETVFATDTLSIKGKNLLGGTVYINMPQNVIIKDVYLEANKTYTVSCENNINAIYVQNNTATQTLFSRYSGKSLTFTPTKSDYYAFNFDRNNAQSTHKFKLEEGFSATLYEPHFESQTVTNLKLPALPGAENKILAGHKVGKNLFGDMHYTKGNPYAYARLPISNKYTISVKLKEGKTIPSGLYLGINDTGEYASQMNYIWLISNGSLAKSQATANTSRDLFTYFVVYPKNYADTIEEYFDIQVEAGLVKTDYEPYIKDRVMKYTAVKQYDLGDLSYGTDTIGRGKYFYSRVDTMIPDIKTPSSTSQAANALCDVYNVVARSQLDNGPDYLLIVAQSGQLNIFDIDKQNMTAQQFKESMVGHKLTYEIAHPYWEDITNTPEGQQILALMPTEHYTNIIELDNEGDLNVNYWQQHDVVPSDYTRVKSLISDGNQNIVVDPGQADSMQYNSLEMSQPRTDLFKEPSKKIINVDGIGLKYNQLISHGNFDVISGVWAYSSASSTIVADNGIAKLTLKNSSYTASNGPFQLYRRLNYIQGHKYIITAKAFYKSTSNLAVVMRIYTLNITKYNYTKNSWLDMSIIFEATQSGSFETNVQSIGAGASVGDELWVKDFMLADLTDMFGAGNEPTTLEQFYATKQGKKYKSYVEYGYHILGAGEYKSNQFVKNGDFSEGLSYWDYNHDNLNALVINNRVEITALKDVSGDSGYIMTRNTLSSNDNNKMILLSFDAEVIEWNGNENSDFAFGFQGSGEYTRYFTHQESLSKKKYSVLIKANASSYRLNSYFQVYNGKAGMKWAFSNIVLHKLDDLGLQDLTIDQLKSQHPELFIPQPYHETETRYGIIFSDGSVDRLDYGYIKDLSTLTWYNEDGVTGRYRTDGLVGICKGADASSLGELICDKYDTITFAQAYNGTKVGISVGSTGAIRIFDPSFNVNSLKNISLKYKLANPKPLYAIDSIKDNYNTNGVVNRKVDLLLPSEYQEVEYIESTGTQYIDTGYKYVVGDLIKLIISTNTTQADTAFYGTFTVNAHEVGKISSSFRLNVSRTVSAALFDGKIKFTLDKNGYWSINDTDYSAQQNASSNQTHSSILFGRYYNGLIDKRGACKIYEFDVKNKLHFVPCYRKSDNVIGMYDTVSKTFFTNQGTGTFLKGADINNLHILPQPIIELREPISEEHMANITGVANEAYTVTYKPQEVSIAKYYKDNKPIGNYIPVVRNSDSKPGMYDPASNVFKTNTGTGEFSYDN